MALCNAQCYCESSQSSSSTLASVIKVLLSMQCCKNSQSKTIALLTVVYQHSATKRSSAYYYQHSAIKRGQSKSSALKTLKHSARKKSQSRSHILLLMTLTLLLAQNKDKELIKVQRSNDSSISILHIKNYKASKEIENCITFPVYIITVSVRTPWNCNSNTLEPSLNDL